MSVKRQLLPFSGQRFDIPHLKSIESSVCYDFDSVLQGIITGTGQPFLIRGFEAKIPEASISASSLEIVVADSAVLHSAAAEAGTIYVTAPSLANEVLSPQNPNVRGSFQNGVSNYVSLEYIRFTDTSTVDQTAGWSQSQKTEFQRVAPIGRALGYRFVISTAGFGSNMPLYIVGVSSTGAVTYITKSTPSLFRLGRGGLNPNPQFVYQWKGLSNPQNPAAPRSEWVNTATSLTTNPVSVVPGDPSSAFQFGDFAIASLKDWMDAVMSRFRELTNSAYWYTDSSLLAKSPNTFDTWWDSVGSVLTGTGNMSYNMILETGLLTYGKFQSKLTDSAMLPTDSYVLGQTSGNTAVLTNFNSNQLIINSLLKTDFIFDEILENRRLYRPNLSVFKLEDSKDGLNAVAMLSRLPQLGGSPLTPTGWSYAAKAIGAKVTVTIPAHTFIVGDFVGFQGLDCTSNSPDGVHQIKEITANTVSFDTLVLPVGVAALLAPAALLDSKQSHPYLPSFSVTAWSYVGTSVTVNAAGHTFLNSDEVFFHGINPAVDGVYAITLNSDTSMTFTVPVAPVGPTTVPVGATAQADSCAFNLTVKGASPDGFDKDGVIAYAYDPAQLLYILGPSTLPTLGTATGAIELDGVVALASVSNPAKIQQITYASTPIPLAASIVINSDIMVVATTGLVPNMVITGTGIAPSTTVTQIIDSTHLKMSNQALSTTSGTYSFTSPYLEVTCFNAHGLVTTLGPISYTIYGPQSISKYVTTYPAVSLVVISPTVFRLVGASVFNAGTYTNAGADLIFAKFPSNPYAGPIAWDSDLIVKGIIGDKYFRIPYSATAIGTDTANKFNVNGQTGTVYLLDGQVAYVLLERNKSVALGASYTAQGGNLPVQGVSSFTDPTGAMLRVGDFIKFEDEAEGSWLKISNTGFPSLLEGDQLPSGTSLVYLVADSGQAPSLAQRPTRTGRLVYCKGTYSEVKVAPHYLVDSSADIYWLAVRRDNNGGNSKVYLKALELDAGESRQISDNTASNLLLYTGANTEAAVNPNYTVIDTSGSYRYTDNLSVGPYPTDLNYRTRTVTFTGGPELGFQVGDKVVKTVGALKYILTVESILTPITVVFKDDIAILALGDAVEYHRINYIVNDQDNLTLAIRKEDRELAKVNTALMRPIYDESVLPVLINLTVDPLPSTPSVDPTDPNNANQIMSGQYIYLGSNPNNPSALAWVLHGTKTLAERIEGSLIGMAGGKFTANSILVHIIAGTFSHGDSILQYGRSPSRQIVNPTLAPFKSTKILGANNVELVLPPNRRTQTVGSEYIVWPANAMYKASSEDQYCGEELMVVINDTVREANIDYIETFGGPKGKIQIVRDMPLNSRFRFRILPSYGSALAKVAGNLTLQIAYDGGAQINVLTGRPVYLVSPDAAVVLKTEGSIEINGKLAGNVVGGILANDDKGFDIATAAKRVNKIYTSELFVKTHGAYPTSENKHETCAGTTVGAGGSALPWALAIPVDYAARVCVRAIARRSDGTAGVAGFEIHGTFYRTVGGLFSAGDAYYLQTGASGDGHNYAIAFGKVGTDIVIVAYGAGVVEWACSIESQSVSLPT